jgi:hypothetical protein
MTATATCPYFGKVPMPTRKGTMWGIQPQIQPPLLLGEVFCFPGAMVRPRAFAGEQRNVALAPGPAGRQMEKGSLWAICSDCGPR